MSTKSTNSGKGAAKKPEYTSGPLYALNNLQRKFEGAKKGVVKFVSDTTTDVKNSFLNGVFNLGLTGTGLPSVTYTPQASKKIKNKKPGPNNSDIPIKSPTIQESAGKKTPSGVDFNLPPHSWSLPLNPGALDGLTSVTAEHMQRRGKMWLFTDIGTFEGASNSTTSGTPDADSGGVSANQQGTGTYARKDLIQLLADKNSTDKGAGSKAANFYKDYGFQFLWNPETINVEVSTNMEVVPDAGDRFRSVAGVFPSQEHITFSLVIDRTNDFACIYRTFYNNNQSVVGIEDSFSQYYKTGLNQTVPNATPFKDKLKNLMEYGTMHDIEYIFKMINAGTWWETKTPTNALDRETYDLGYLYPALIAVEFGPTIGSVRPLSYVGWLQAISIKHTAFNTNMIPLRTEIAFNIWGFTGMGLTTN